jgi:prolyl-tRNA synthetase
VIGIHGDEKGLFFPPEIAPIQVVIVPIARAQDVQVLEYAQRVREILELNR